MDGLLEYYITGGKMIFGKKEMTFELLRRDSIFRELLGYKTGTLMQLLPAFHISEQGKYVIFEFNGCQKLRLGGDPTPMLNELKARYGENIGGMLSFSCVYTTFMQTSYLQANLDAENIVLAFA